jgi:cytochrome c5
MKKLTVMLAALSFTVLAQTPADTKDQELENLKARIAPVGSVYLAGAATEAAKPAGPRTGDQVYNTTCIACHGSGALGAPKKGTADWKPRLEQGLEVLHKHALEGIRSMPPRGTCADCSDDEILAAIKFMTEGV